jgi:hypothetical protein
MMAKLLGRREFVVVDVMQSPADPASAASASQIDLRSVEKAAHLLEPEIGSFLIRKTIRHHRSVKIFHIKSTREQCNTSLLVRARRTGL